jgi:hypothetical protein
MIDYFSPLSTGPSAGEIRLLPDVLRDWLTQKSVEVAG